MNPFDLKELFSAAWQNPRLAKPYVFGRHAEARHLRAVARIKKRKSKR